MTLARQTEVDLLAATARRLEAEGYDVVVDPDASLLPDALKSFRPDGVAIGKRPNLVVEVASEGPRDARRIAELQRALKGAPDWRLHLVLVAGSPSMEIGQVDESSITSVVDRAEKLVGIEPAGALLLGWAALEALSRSRMPDVFARPQSPARIVEHFASEALITPSEAALLRSLAAKRNSFIHGDLAQQATSDELQSFLDLIRTLTNSPTQRFALDKTS